MPTNKAEPQAKAAHTPDRSWACHPSFGEPSIAIYEGGNVVARVLRGNLSRDQQADNARLIAAAPELLAEVNEGELFARWMAREFRAFAGMDPNDSRIREGFVRLTKAAEARAGFFRAAIAKPEGRAS